jgi:hypothetical protein
MYFVKWHPHHHLKGDPMCLLLDYKAIWVSHRAVFLSTLSSRSCWGCLFPHRYCYKYKFSSVLGTLRALGYLLGISLGPCTPTTIFVDPCSRYADPEHWERTPVRRTGKDETWTCLSNTRTWNVSWGLHLPSNIGILGRHSPIFLNSFFLSFYLFIQVRILARVSRVARA